jgi:hypothetical protein
LLPARPHGFQSGKTNPSAQRSIFLAAQKPRVAETARARRAAAQATFNPDGVKFTHAGKRGAISTRECALVLHHKCDLGRTQLQAGAAAGVSQQSVSLLLKRVRRDLGSNDDAGAELPVATLRATKKRSNGRPSLLTPAMATSVKQAIKRDPFGGVGEVHKALLEHGLVVPLRTLYSWLERLDVHTRATSLYADFNERLIHGLLNHIEGVSEALASGGLKFENFAYVDQTPVFILTGHNTSYGESVVFGDGSDAKGGKKVGNVWAVISVQGCMRAWVTDINGDEESAKQFFLSDALPPGWTNLFGADGNIFDLLAAHGKRLPGRRRKIILCLDRLGKSGASEYSIGGHHAPELRVRAAISGVGLLMLPPKGALVNPIELWNMHAKREMNAAKPEGEPKDNWEQLIRGPRNKSEAFQMLTAAIIKVNGNRPLLRWFYHMRCTGADAQRRLQAHSIYVAVLAARAAQPVAPFNVLEAAFAPRARMSTQHAYPASRCRAETYTTYFWRHHWLGLHAGLPPPFVRPVDKDGYEKCCRLCSRASNGAKARDTLQLCCESCPGVFHYECVGLKVPPAGIWKCAACLRGDVGQLRKWKDPNPKPRTTTNQRKRRRAADSDGEPTSSEDE